MRSRIPFVLAAEDGNTAMEIVLFAKTLIHIQQTTREGRTMAEYINRQAVLNHKRKMQGFGFTQEDDFWDFAVLVEDIEKIPTADVQEVKHGRWIEKTRHEHYPSGKEYISLYCSICGKKVDEYFDYCPNCGARMGSKPEERK